MPDLLFANGESAADTWHWLDDESPSPDSGDIVVSLTRWLESNHEFSSFDGRVGVQLTNTDDPRALAGKLDGLDLIALQFPSFTDGRAYSQARCLRQDLAYDGYIRACGDVLQDQLAYMQRCGFDCFEFPENIHTENLAKSIKGFSATYQPHIRDARPRSGIFA